ncbi:MAG: serine/threonine-protein kinase [Planctomycetota bacterium]
MATEARPEHNGTPDDVGAGADETIAASLSSTDETKVSRPADAPSDAAEPVVERASRDADETVVDQPPQGDDATRTVAAGSVDIDADATMASAGRQAPAPPPMMHDEYQPDQIGQYTIERVLASGGMGTVYVATQEQPRRTVALKVMKPGIVSPSTLRRFDYEVEILGRLRHPNIAQVYEAGTHDDGRGGMPYFVMEFVPNALTLNAYAESHQLSTNDRLRLFLDICDAIHHGHQKGVIHRDLKPGNILIDANGTPKIIDFGVARATDSDMQGATMQTEVGQLVGTVQYMSPEQVEADPSKIDTRSDVYALGVVLHEFLTGRLPYDLSSMPIYEATRVIRETDVQRVGTAHPEFKGDVETIILHALEKEPERRYQSANALRNDIERYLNDEPISARPPSTVYAFQKFYRRNRTFVAVVAMCAVGLVVLTGASIGFGVAAMNAKSVAENAQGIAEKKTTTAERTVDYFVRGVVASVDARDGKGGPDYTVLEMLDDIEAEIENDLGGEPEVAAAVRGGLGFAWKEASDFSAAEAQLIKSIELFRSVSDEPSALLAEALNNLGAVYWFQSRFSEARAVLGEALVMRQQVFGDAHEKTAETIEFLAACDMKEKDYRAALDQYRESLRISRAYWDGDNEYTARTMNNMAMCLLRMEQYEDASMWLERATRLVRAARGDRHVDVAGGLSNHASCLMKLNRMNEAEPMLIEALSIKREVYSDVHHSVATTLSHLAQLNVAKGAIDQANTYQREALHILATVFESPSHPRTKRAVEALAYMSPAEAPKSEAQIWSELAERHLEAKPNAFGWSVGALQLAAQAHLGLEEYEQAQARLDDAWGMADREALEESVMHNLAGDFVSLYSQWNRPEDVAIWTKRRETLNATPTASGN